MLQYKIIERKNIYRFLLLIMTGTLLFNQTNAQRRGEASPGKVDRPRESRPQQAPREQSPRMNDQPPRATRDVQFDQPRPVQRPPRIRNSTESPRASNIPPRVNNNPRPPRENSVPPRVNNNPRPPRANSTPPPRVNSNPRQSPPPPRVNNNNDNNNRFRPVQAARRPNHYWPHRGYSATNPGWRYLNLPRRNTIITSFAFPYQTINYGGYGYRYCDGIYYQPYNNFYRVVAPPFGIFINILPFGYRRIVVHDYPYYYYNGTYYDDYESSYRVVAPPVGAIVESIPDGYETIVIDGETYYKVDDVQYKPVVQDNGEIWYQVIKVG